MRRIIKISLFMSLVVLLLPIGLRAQGTINGDMLFIGGGGVYNSVTAEDYLSSASSDSLTFMGYSIAAEYMFNMMPLMISIGFEYQKIESDSISDLILEASNAVVPVTLKLMTGLGGFIGIGASGVYNITNDASDGRTYDKKFDIWANACAGVVSQVSDRVYYSMYVRGGYNLTKNQWSEYTLNGVVHPFNVDMAFDMGIYLMFGYHFGTESF
jgi:hypothetical protein